MGGHAEVGDAEQIRDQRAREAAEVAWKTYPERMAAMREAREAKARETWPIPCPTCFAGVGEKCITRTGGRTPRHATRVV